MKKGALKLLLSTLATGACAVSLTASTFAYVVMSNSVEVTDFYFDIEGQEGLLISIDGENFQQDIPSDQLKESIAEELGITVQEFNNQKFTGVTPLQDSGLVKYTNGKIDFGYDVADTVNPVHRYEDATANRDYIRFDLWFKPVSTVTTSTSNFKLELGQNTVISSITEDVDIENTFTIGTNKYGPKADIKKVTQSVKNAIRLGLYSENETTDKLRIFEVTDDNDLGTTAIEGRTDNHNPASNIMYNYYNVIHPLYPFTKGAEDGEAYDTIPQFGTLNNNVWNGEYVSKFDENGIAKVTVYIWLEGWDADYLLGTSATASEIGATLEFTLTSN